MESYFYQALSSFLTAPPPEKFKTVKQISDINDADWEELQTHAVDNSVLSWTTGISIIEAAQSLVVDAISNANIKSHLPEKA